MQIGNKITETNENEFSKQYAYDNVNRLNSITDAHEQYIYLQL